MRRSMTGKFYYRPPGGESWTDVALRVRQFLTELRQAHGDQRVWIFTHQAVIMSFRLVLERLDEQRLLEIDRSRGAANCSLRATPGRQAGALRLETFGCDVAPGVPRRPDDARGASA